MEGQQINLLIFVMRIVVGANNGDVMNFLLMLEAFENLNPKQIAIVWTHADKDEDFTPEKGVEVITELHEDSMKDAEGFAVPPPENQFLFRGAGENQTTTEELRDWIFKIMPKDAPLTANSALSAEKVFTRAIKMTNPQLQEYAKQAQDRDNK